MKAILIANPKAGQGRAVAGLLEIDAALYERGTACEIALTHAEGQATALARSAAESGYETVIACGGDGTVNEVINGLVGTQARLGVMPLGTVNVLARELRIPLDLPGAAQVIAQGATRKIDLGLVSGRYFTLMAGLGFDAQVVATVLPAIKNIIGSSAYVLKILETLTWYHASHVTLDMEAESYSTDAFLVIVANACTYTYGLKIAPRASCEDGVLDICIFEKPMTDVMGFVRQLAELFMNRHLDNKAVRYFQTPSVRISSEPEVMLQIDGEAVGRTPVEISVVPRALQVLVPS